jgi:hypothetical protein
LTRRTANLEIWHLNFHPLLSLQLSDMKSRQHCATLLMSCRHILPDSSRLPTLILCCSFSASGRLVGVCPSWATRLSNVCFWTFW